MVCQVVSSNLDSVGILKKIRSKFSSYCSKCHYTIWFGELVWYDGRARHLDCTRAIKDSTPRVLDERYLWSTGPEVKQLINKMIARSKATGK